MVVVGEWMNGVDGCKREDGRQKEESGGGSPRMGRGLGSRHQLDRPLHQPQQSGPRNWPERLLQGVGFCNGI